jgi:hypothetical protein
MTTDLKLAFGCVKALPEGTTTAWGARLIWPNDLVWDRQDMVGPEREELARWLNDGVLRSVLRMLGEGRFDLRRDEDRTLTLYEDETGRVVGNPQGSHGYLYAAAWLKGEATHADA